MKSKDQSKKELLQEIDRVNTLLKEEADEKGVGRKNSLQILSGLKTDNQAYSARLKLEMTEIVRRTLMRNWDEKKARGMLPTGNRKALETKAARLLKISPVTAQRHMNVLRSPGGPFGGLGDDVYLNEFYVSPEEDDYWLDDDEEGE